jgi:hypothetical protein
MRILDEKQDTSVNRVTILLTQNEAQELRDSLESLLHDGKGQHAHIPDNDFRKEITIAIYTPGDLNGFNQRCQKLIRENC